MKRFLYLIILYSFGGMALAQHTFQDTSLSEALIALDKSTKRYDISFVYDELEDFTVTKTVKRGRPLPKAVREVCGFYPVRVSVKGRNILVECLQKDRTKLMGRLTGPDRQPIAYANITLSSPSDTVYIGGGVSNEAGDFVIPCGAERARVRISCVGFKTIERLMPIGNAGTILMQMEDYYLNNVTVSGRLPVIRSEADRLQYIVSNDEFARGLSAQELLSRVPMVTMAGTQAMILGKGPARFMLNGRITEMGDEVIRQKLWTMRSEDIDRIEVLSVPSGRDMMEAGGCINIVTRRDQAPGWRGDVSMETGVSDDWSGRASGSLSYASEKFDMTIDAHGGRLTQTTDNLTAYDMQNFILLSNTHAKRTDKELATSLTLRYQPAKNLELGGMLSWQTLWPEKVTYGEVSLSGQTAYSEARQKPNDRTMTRSLTAYCDWRLDSKGKMLSLSYSDYKKEDDAKSMVSTDDYQYWDSSTGLWYPIKEFESFGSDLDYHIQSARLDLTLPSGFATIDIGASYTNIRNQVDMNTQKSNIMSYLIYAGNLLDYREKTRSAYLSLHRDWERFAIKAGLHYEHIGRDEEATAGNINQALGKASAANHESDDYWLPSATLSYKPQEGHQINISWGTSCVRPNFYYLNPFRDYKTAWEYSEGNPLLKPGRTNDIELNYHNRHGLYASAYYHHGSDMVIPTVSYVEIMNSKGRIHQAVTSYSNDGRINQTGLYLRYQRQMAEHLMVTAEGAVYYHDAETGRHPSLSGWGKRIAVSADWYLNSRHTLLLNGRYQHWFADYRDLTETDSYGYFCLALRYAMLDDRLKLSLVANDPFHQHVTDETLYDINEGHTNHHSHYIGLTATCSFGGKKVRHASRHVDNAETKRAEKQ